MTPGVPTNLISLYTPDISPTTCFDPTHPGVDRPRVLSKLCPRWKCKFLEVRAFPKAFLAKIEDLWPDPPFTMMPYPMRDLSVRDRKRQPMSITIMSHMMPLTVWRRVTIRRRLKAAVELIVVRGARAVPVEGSGHQKGAAKRVVLDETEVGRDRMVSSGMYLPGYSAVLECLYRNLHVDWTYVFIPRIELFLMPFAEIISLVRDALETIKLAQNKLDTQWAKMRAKPASVKVHHAQPSNAGPSVIESTIMILYPVQFTDRPTVSPAYFIGKALPG